MSSVHVVLVGTQYPRNLGASARACGNMGAGRLIAIEPQCDPFHLEAHQGAAGAQKHLQELTVYESLASFLEQESNGIRIAFTARSGKNRPNFVLPQLLKILQQDQSSYAYQADTPLYLFFGREDDGLSTEQLESCQFAARLPVFGEFKSLNLAHAVQLALYIVQDWRDQQQSLSHREPERELVDLQSGPLVTAWLSELGFDLSSPRVNAAKTLSSLFDRSLPNAKEKEIFEKVMQQNLRKLKEGKKDGVSV